MQESSGHPEITSILTVIAHLFNNASITAFLDKWQNVLFSLIAAGLLILTVFILTRKLSPSPGRLQAAAEFIAGGIDDFICGILGPEGRKYTPFLGTLFLYIFVMNILGVIPFMRSPTASWSTTLALSLCVFCYVQFTALRTMGFLGYLDHLAGKPRGAIAFSVVLPLLILVLHILAEFIRPISLSLRLRSNIWGDDLLLVVLAGFGLKGILLLFVNTLSAILVALIQSVVFCLLSTIYFAMALVHE